MSRESTPLARLEEYIGALDERDRLMVNAIADEIRNLVRTHGHLGGLALGLVGAQAAAMAGE